MSLSRILNNDEPPSLVLRAVPSATPTNGRAYDIPSGDPSTISAPRPPSPRRHYAVCRSPSPHAEHPPQARGHSYQPVSYQGTGGWNPYSGEYVQGDIFPLGRGGNYYPARGIINDPQPRVPRGSSAGVGAYYKSEENESTPRKRRKAADEDSDYQPPGTRRATLRRSTRSKTVRQASPNGETVHRNMNGADHRHLEEDRRLVSSDLSDCEELWINELSDYVIETHKRRRQVEEWFDTNVLQRNTATAVSLSRHYVSRIARIPLPPPSPPPMPSHSLDDDLLSTVQASPPLEPVDLYEYDGNTRPRRTGHSKPHTSGAEAAAQLEDALLGEGSRKHGASSKRLADGTVSDGSSVIDSPSISVRKKPATKKRKLDKDPIDITDELERSISVGNALALSSKSLLLKSKGKGKQAIAREGSPDSISAATTPKGKKKVAGKKKSEALLLDTVDSAVSAHDSVAGDVTPSASRPTSPALTVSSTVVYELDEVAPPLKRAKKVDEIIKAKRLKSLEEAQRKVWTNIAKREVAKVYKYAALGYQARQGQMKRVAMLSSMQARRPFTRTTKGTKDVQAKGKRMMREMLVSWKRNEREERDVRKREQKEAIDRAKVEEEKREATRQARKLEFLISQTELYSHFVGNKLKTAEVQGDVEDGYAPAGADGTDIDPKALQEIDFDDDDQTNLHRHARHNAQEAIALAKQRAQAFDTQAALERKTNEALKLARGQAHIRDEEDDGHSAPNQTPLVDLDSDELNFQNPSSLSGPLTISQPTMLMAQLKEYQLKGLNWLATLYEQGINGILADEMGLGKTVQSISLIAYLAEVHDIWGPFLVVAPASTLHNWQQEITRFVPGLKALPYWGSVKDRATLRKFWSKKEISYDKDAPFHVLITSYQLVIQDQQYFQRLKWQYMILDEAQNIKNASSVRWKTLLGFHCRNRLLLTGTPIQNSMQELWALLHFIMPTLFDSHDEFNEWFSKDIENAAENKGSKLNEHQLRRLHMILKPFMLRRVKRHVQNELSEKIEIDIFVDLSSRQRALYRALLANVSIADLLEKAANIGDADSARSLMNLVMQFRKVCNHPELFERADVIAPFSFAEYGRSGPLNREGDFVTLPYSTQNPIRYTLPELIYLDRGLVNVPYEEPAIRARRTDLSGLFNIWSKDWIHRSLYNELERSPAFAFLRLLNSSPSEVHELQVSPWIKRRLLEVEAEIKLVESRTLSSCSDLGMPSTGLYGHNCPLSPCFDHVEGLPHLTGIASSFWQQSCLSRPGLKWYAPAAVAPPITMYCGNRTFLDMQSRIVDAPLESLVMFGVPRDVQNSEDACKAYRGLVPLVPPVGLFNISTSDQVPPVNMQIPEAKRLVYDSAKLARLDSLLQELKAGDHRVLIYFQMTRMMDLMEEYLIFRQYKYLRLDGSSKLEDRRDMVMDWQTRPDIFIFLLSTRAGGLGINLTAADTVIFYDHDWNPSNDAQAMDRAHRLGQTRQVTVYRLITRGTIDERIIQLARVKKDVQDIVVGNKNFTDVTKPSEIVQLLLNDDQLAGIENNPSALSVTTDGTKPVDPGPARDLWNDEGDDFFGHTTGPTNQEAEEEVEAPVAVTTTSTRGKKRKVGSSSARSRKVTGKNSKKDGGEHEP